MYIKIYFGDKPVFLCDEIDPTIHEYLHHPDAIFIDEINNSAIKSLMHEIKKNDFHAGILWHPDLEKLKKAFWKHFKIVLAAGGWVVNEKDEILFIFRRGKWDLPKGKLDKGEKLEECAQREVREETGLQHIKLKDKITTTFHTYDEFGKHILKESHWYRMKGKATDKLKAQADEGIQSIEWVTPSGIEKKLQNSFPSISDVCAMALLV